MEKLKNMKIGNRLMLSYIVILVLLVVSVIVSVLSLFQMGQQITSFYEHPFQVSASANIVNAKFEEMQKAVFRALSTEDAAITEESINDASVCATVIQENLGVIEELYLGNHQDIIDLENKLEELAPMRQEVLALAAENANVEAAAYMESHNIPLIEEIQVDLDNLIKTADQTGETMINSLQRRQGITTILLIVLGVISLVVSLIFARFITYSITVPIEQMERASENLAQGILDAEIITYEAKDEVGHLADNMKVAITGLNTLIADVSYLMKEMSVGNLAVKSSQESVYRGAFKPMLLSIREMNQNISNTIREINESSEQVLIGSTQMAESAQGLAEGATEQAGAVEELTATIDDVANTAQMSADEAKDTSQKIDASAERAEISRQEMEKLTAAMQRIDETSKEIVNIIASIEDIASQTNLLSLNASIEAARAGDAGKGFAVVADQIGKLASDSAQSAANTRDLIMKTLEEIRVGNDITAVTSEAFSNIIKEIEVFAKEAEDISNKSWQQFESLKQVSEGVNQISNVVQNNSAAAEETSATSEELAAQADNLKALVGRFQIEGKK